MATTTADKVDRVESAANITLHVANPASDDEDAQMLEVPISRLDTTKDVEISEIRENTLKANAYSITAISYSGTMMFKGSRLTKLVDANTDVSLDDVLYDQNGVPKPCQITINHDLEDKPEEYQHVLVTSDSYEVRSEEATETAYDWIAFDRAADQPDQ